MTEASFTESLDRLKESFLWAAAQQGNTQDCESLVEIGADVNYRNDDGDTPLLAACRRGHAETIASLLAHGADANIAGRDSLTPLHICTRRGDDASVDALLNASISTSTKTSDGLTALDIAKNKGFENIYARLMENRQSGLGRLPSTSDQSAALIENIRNELPSNDRNRLARGGSRRKSELNRLIDAAHATNDQEITSSMQQLQQLSRIISNPTGATNAAATSAISVNMQNPPPRGMQRSISLDKQPIQRNSSSDAAYAIINQTGSNRAAEVTADAAALAALQRILDEERAMRAKLEQKLDIFKDQNSQLLQEYAALSKQLGEAQEEASAVEHQLNRYLGERDALEGITLEECELVEKRLKEALEKVEMKKSSLVKEQMEKQEEQRLCVICQEREKSVVLLPCRHLCLCDTCCNYEDLTNCPLCREAIVHKISVFS